MRILVCALVSLFGTSCAGGPVAPTSCDSPRDCSAAGLVCDLGRAICVECVLDADCPGTEERCVARTCMAPRPCTSSRECPGLVCDPGSGFCVECVADVDCSLPGERCVERACFPPEACTTDADCSAPTGRCEPASGECVECVETADCASGESCSSGACVRSDGGLDAGADDAAPPDAPALDAALDSPTDAGPPPTALIVCDWEGTGHGPTAFRAALTSLGWTYTFTDFGRSFPDTFAEQSWDLVVVSHTHATLEGDTQLLVLRDYVAAGGPLIVLENDLTRTLSPSFVSWTEITEAIPAGASYTTPLPLFAAPASAIDLFAGVPSPVRSDYTTGWATAPVGPYPSGAGGVIAATLGPGGAGAIVVTRGGHVIVGGFSEPNYAATIGVIAPFDDDADGVPDIQELVANMIRAVAGP